MNITLNSRQYVRVCEALQERIDSLQDSEDFARKHGMERGQETMSRLKFEFCELLSEFNRAQAEYQRRWNPNNPVNTGRSCSVFLSGR